MKTYYKEQLLGDVMDFCEAKVAGDKREMEERVNSIFSTAMIRRRFDHGAASRSYGFYGAKEISFVYTGITREQWCDMVEKRTKELFMEKFDVELESVSSETIARKMVNKFLALYIPNAYTGLTIDRAKEMAPDTMSRLSVHYFHMYIAMRKNGKELTDYNVFDKASMEKMIEDTGIREVSAYRMFSAFGHISKDEADMLRLRAHGVNNPKCKAQYLYKYNKAKEEGFDASRYDVNDIGSMKKMSETTGWTVKECHKIIDNLALDTKKEPVKKVLSSITINLNDLIIE